MEFLDRLRSKGVSDAELVWKILDQSPDCIKVLGLDGELEYMNPNGRVAMDIDDFAAVVGNKLPDMWPDESRPALEAAMCIALSGGKHSFEAYCPTVKGEPRFWQVTVSPICDPDGRPTHLLCTSRDITWWRNEQDAKLLRVQEDAAVAVHAANELAHNTRNQLSIISALARVSLGRDGNFARERLMERIGKVAASIDAIEGSERTVAIGRIVATAIDQIAGLPRFELSAMPEERINSETARVVTLILGELESNALSHGALSGQGGKVSLSVERVVDGLAVVWKEQLDRAPTKPITPGTGFRLVDRLSAMLPEPASYTWSDEGLTVRFTLSVH